LLVARTWDLPGLFSEVLKVVDAVGRIDYDFAAVQVLDSAHLDRPVRQARLSGARHDASAICQKVFDKRPTVG